MLLLRTILLFLTMTGVALLSPEIKPTLNDNYSQKDYSLDLFNFDLEGALLTTYSASVLSSQPEILKSTTKAPDFSHPHVATGLFTKPFVSKFNYLKNCRTIALRLARFSIAFPFHDFP